MPDAGGEFWRRSGAHVLVEQYAVPEEDGGRVIVPAKKAFTNKDWGVYKVDIPL